MRFYFRYASLFLSMLVRSLSFTSYIKSTDCRLFPTNENSFLSMFATAFNLAPVASISLPQRLYRYFRT